MEDAVIVIMLKEKKTGFLEKELSCCSVKKHDQFLLNAYASEDEGGNVNVVLRLTCERDVLDWEFDAIFDYYDETVFSALSVSCREVQDCFNPTWELVFGYDEASLEAKVNNILEAHVTELSDVYECIKDKKNEYLGN